MQELQRFNEDCLYAHNGLRKAHGVGSLTYDKNLAINAQNYAEILAENKLLQHSSPETRNNCGENLAQSMKSFVKFVYSGLGATVNWYSEIKDYDFGLDNQITKKTTGHFTQVIWKGSQTAGFGRAKNEVNNTWYIVGRYFPSGNVKRQYKQNVPPLPNNLIWENVGIVEKYLEELKLWEFTKARKHVLDSYSYSVAELQNNKGFLVKENFKPIEGDIYYESQIFETNVTKEPRPVSIESSLINNKNPNVPAQNNEPLPVSIESSLINNKKPHVPAQNNEPRPVSIGSSLINNKKSNVPAQNNETQPTVNKFSANNKPKENIIPQNKNDNTKYVEANKSDTPIPQSIISNQTFIESLLSRHNFHRKHHGVKQLFVDQELCRNAQNWANHLCDKFYLGFSNHKFKFSEVGENIVLKNGDLTEESAKKLVDNWYNENEFYFYDMKINDIKEYGHFTQIVWRNTEKIGIGICTEESGFNFIVCFYYPPGNIKSDFHKMVPRLI